MRLAALSAACAAAAVIAGFLAWARFKPLDAHALALRERMWLGGGRRVKLGAIEALLRDSCGGGGE
ncbi:MAG: hypothetical protein WCI75_19700 [candidate division NC10 bacterium]